MSSLRKQSAKDKVDQFAPQADNIKKTRLSNYIERFVANKLRITPNMVKNFIILWETIESADLKYALTKEICHDTLNLYGSKTIEEQFSAYHMFTSGAGEESKRFDAFIDEYILANVDRLMSRARGNMSKHNICA